MPSWKKIIVSGSNAELNQLTATSYGGNISGSATSTGSFGKLLGDGSQLTNVASPFTSAGISGSFTDASSSLAGRITTEEGNVDTLQGRTLTAGAGLTGGGTLASDRTFNVVGGTGITANANEITTTDGEIVHDNLSGFVENEHIDHSSVSVVAGTGLTGGGTIAANRTLNVIGGDGITANANDIAITAAQTTIESIYKADLVIGEDAQTKIDFETVNEIHFDVNNKELLNLTGDIVSGSAASTGSFGRLQATAIGGNSPINIENPTLVGDTEVQGDFNVTGDITAQNFIVSSSVTSIEYQSLSGSTIFGDTMDDTHQITGSVFITGSTTVSERLTATEIGAFKATGAINFDSQNMTNVDIDSGTITGITDLIVADGGTGVSTLTDGGVLLGSGTGAITAMAVLTDGQMIVGDGTTDPVAESGATLRTSIGVGTGDDVVLASLETSGNISGSATSTGSFGRTEGTSFRYEFDSAGSFEYNNDAISYRNGGNEKFKVDNSQLTTEAVNTGRVYLGGNNKVQLDETGVALVISQNDGGMVTTLTLDKEGFLTLPRDTGGIYSVGNISGSATSTGSFGSLRIDDMSVPNIGLVSGSFSTRVSALKADSGSFSTRVSALKADSGSFSTRTSTLEAGTFGGNVNIAGNLTVNGDTTTIATTNILVQDAFGFFATGSAGTNVDAGIIVQSGSFVDSGSALYHDISKERWSVGKGVASTATNVPDSKWGGFVATVYTGSASPVGAAPKYGVGEIHVDGDGEIYIYS